MRELQNPGQHRSLCSGASGRGSHEASPGNAQGVLKVPLTICSCRLRAQTLIPGGQADSVMIPLCAELLPSCTPVCETPWEKPRAWHRSRKQEVSGRGSFGKCVCWLEGGGLDLAKQRWRGQAQAQVPGGLPTFPR